MSFPVKVFRPRTIRGACLRCPRWTDIADLLPRPALRSGRDDKARAERVGVLGSHRDVGVNRAMR